MTESYNHHALPAGTMIQEYRIDRVLGQGAVGIIYLAHNQYLEEEVAIKEFLPTELAQRVDGSTVVPTSSNTQERYAWALDKFVAEAQILWELGRPHPHPNIVRVSRFHKANGTAYMVMDFEQGESLADRLVGGKTLNEDETRALLIPLLDGLERVHAKSIWHRDIKPANILLRTDNSPVLIDFGAARWELDDAAPSALAMFTPHYAAPEQIYSEGKLGPWTDIYGLAATFYHAMVGRPPVSASDRALGGEHLGIADAVKPGVFSANLLSSIESALALRFEDRPQSAALWRRMLEGETTPADATVIAAAPITPPADATVIAPARQAASRAENLDPMSALAATASEPLPSTPPPTVAQTPPAHSERKRRIPGALWLALLLGIPAVIAGLNYPALLQVFSAKDAGEVSSQTTATGDDTAQSYATPDASDAPETAVVETPQVSVTDRTDAASKATTSPPVQVQSAPTEQAPQETTATADNSTQQAALSPTPQSVTEVETPEPDVNELAAGARTLAAQLPCAHIEVSTGAGSLTLSGFVASDADLSTLRNRIAALGKVDIAAQDIAIYPPPFCTAMQVLAQYRHLDTAQSGLPQVTLNKPGLEYIEGEQLVITLSTPRAFDGYLYLDYIDSEGALAHLLPDGTTSDTYTAGQKLTLGADDEYEIVPPHGRSMVMVIASKEPLFAQPRPDDDDAKTYLSALAQRLREIEDSAAGGVMSGHVFFSSKEAP